MSVERERARSDEERDSARSGTGAEPAEGAEAAARGAGADPGAEPAGDTPAWTRAEARPASSLLYGVLNLVLVATILLLVNTLSFRHYQRWDWTTHGLYTLSERSQRVLADLDEDVDIWLVLAEEEPEFQQVRNLVALYEAESPRIRVHYVDPYRAPEAYARLAARYGLGVAVRMDLEGSGAGMDVSDVAAVVATPDRHWAIERTDLVQRRFNAEGDGDELEISMESEQALTGALVELTTGRPTRLCLTRGHGEMELDELSERSLSALADQLRRENLELEEVVTRGADALPEECDAVAVIGPQVALEDAEARVLRDYLRSGGNLLLALDPNLTPELRPLSATGLERMLRDVGIRVERSLVVEVSPEYLPASGHPYLYTYATVTGDHPITSIFGGAGVVGVSGARPVLPASDGGAVRVLLETSPLAYAESDVPSLQDASRLEPDSRDQEGPISLAVATRVEVLGDPPEDGAEMPDRDPRGGRLVVVGDATIFASPLLSDPRVRNLDLASAIVNWLSAREALVSIPPREIEQRPVRLTQGSIVGIFLRTVIGVPAVFVLLGFGVWWGRRS
ncbi:MAG: GldG family protein [Sandaracinaceae bacterium]